MKYLFLITAFINFNLSLNTSGIIYEGKNIDLPQSLAEQYYDKLELNVNLPKMLNRHLDRKALIRTEVPSELWQEIKESIDYVYFKAQIVPIIPNYYTDSELQTILDTHVNRPHIPITKIDFRRGLWQKMDSFININAMNTINTMLSENGYSPI